VLSEKKTAIPLKRLATDLKKILREQGISLRFVLPGKGDVLNAAQSIFNTLTEKPNRELMLITEGSRVLAVDILDVQDIQAYEQRDTARPARDAYVGMLPPKLAQMMLNFALAPLSFSKERDGVRCILDPFCGSGTILQEGWLMDYRMYGSDSSADMLAASEKNLAYIQEHFKVNPALSPTLKKHDARQEFPPEWKHLFDAVVAEPYLGKPLLAPLPEAQLEAEIKLLSKLYADFFKAGRTVLKENGVILLALPAFKSEDRFILFPETFIDQIQEIGYRRIQLIPQGEALYARPDALVGRELTLWQKL